MKSYFRREIVKFQAKDLKVEEGYLEGNSTRLENFVAGIWRLQQKTNFSNRLKKIVGKTEKQKGCNSKIIQSSMGDHFRLNLQYLKDGLKRLTKKEKKNILVAIGTSIFIMGVFFYIPPGEVTLAKSPTPKKLISLAEVTPVKKLGTFTYKDPKEKKKPAIKASSNLVKEIKNANSDEQRIAVLVAGHPIEEMTRFISKRDKKVASFLVAIAKKESNWGTHSPKKAGKNCFNYWGFKGAYNLTESGYSCFDSPEQAVKEVGDRIETLLNQQINTPSRMIVWKCGRTCTGHDPAGVAKWISDVALYYGKMNS